MAGDRGDGFLVLSDAMLEGLGVQIKEIADAVEAAVRAQAAGQIFTAPKSALIPGDGRYMMTTLSTADAPDMTVVKSVMVSPRNPGRGLPGVEGNILLQDSETGRVRAVMEAGWVTAVRTAGLSAVVAKRMADPASKKIGFIGTGVQARSHLAAFFELFPLEAISAFGRGQENIDRLCAMAEGMGLSANACATPEEALEDADLVVSSVTLSFELQPFLDANWLKPGAFASITDLAAPWMAESMDAIDAVIIDDLEQERASPKKMVNADLIRGDLSGLVTGTTEAAFQAGKRSAFIFRGLAIGDFAVACLAYERARTAGMGTEVRWS